MILLFEIDLLLFFFPPVRDQDIIPEIYWVALKVNVKMEPHIVSTLVFKAYLAELYFLLLSVGAG